ncbi:MAG TPA: tetratricopeptide repeat protein, partial [Gemmatimonadales bacterium]|nr:tetratricopeptide repeat protein [Gemmatimonadales bacterium]
PCLLLLAATTPAAAQSVAQRDAILALHDSAQSADKDGLAALRSAPSPASSQDPDLIRLRKAFLLLRQGVIDSSARILRKAGDEFYNVTARHDDWPLAWYGIGLTERALARGRFPVLPARFHPLGADHNQGAIQAFVYALQKDPDFLAATEGLAEATQATTRWGYTGKARNALKGAGAQSVRTLLVRARLEREDKQRTEALALFNQALQLGADSGVTYLEIAREEFALGRDSQATASYWRGVELSTSDAAVQMLREQLGLIARPGELAGFDSLTTLGRLSLVRRFWTLREVDGGLPPGARIEEHYRRYELVSNGFSPRNHGMTPVSPNRADRMAAAFGYGMSPTTAPLLDNGYQQSYIADGFSTFYSYLPRLGDPISQAVRQPWGWNDETGTTTSSPYSARRLTQTYQVMNTRILAGGMLDDIDPSTSPYGSRGEAMLRYGEPTMAVGGMWIYRNGDGEVYVPVNGRMPGSVCDVFSRYCAAEARGYLRPEEYRELRETLLSSRAELLRGDRMLRKFKGTLNAAVDAYAMIDGGTGEGRIVVALAVPADQIEPQAMLDGFLYPVRIQLIAAPPSGAYRVERDTTRYFRTERRLGPNEYLQAVEVLPVTPSSYHLRVVIQTVDGSRGTVGGDDTVEVGSIRRGIALSDLVLGRDSSGLSWWSGT